MRIAIVHRFDVADVLSLSGFPFFMARALRDHVGEVIYLCPENSLLTRIIENVGRVLNRIAYRTVGLRLSPNHHRFLSRRLGRMFASRVAKCGCDIIFAPVASAEVANLSTKVPIVYMTDITWADFVDYYPAYSSLFEFAHEEGERIESAAITKASAIIFPSQWAADTATKHYMADPLKVHYIPFGANFDEGDIPSREEASVHSLEGGINLLWVGVDWERKGGRIAYECLIELLRRGIDARMVVCGCIPPQSFRHPKLEIIPFLNKRDPIQRQELSGLFLKANFFLLPTLAEATAIVLCEASAHGLPSLVRNTGGVGGAVSDGENGFLMAPDATGEDYADRIIEASRNQDAYNSLVKTSRMAYEERLNWNAWALAAKPIFEQVVGAASSESRPFSYERQMP